MNLITAKTRAVATLAAVFVCIGLFASQLMLVERYAANTSADAGTLAVKAPSRAAA